jgi:hypothetical protein
VSDLEERVSSLEKKLADIPDRLEQEARVALLEHHTSQMQGYKIYLLTIAVGSVGLVEAYSRLEEWIPPHYMRLYWPLVLGVMGAGAFYCAARIAWYGALSGKSLLASSDKEKTGTLIYQLDQGISIWARDKKEREIRYKKAYGKDMPAQRDNKIWLGFVNLGYNSRRLVHVTMGLFLVASGAGMLIQWTDLNLLSRILGVSAVAAGALVWLVTGWDP